MADKEYIERGALLNGLGPIPAWDGYNPAYPFEVHLALVEMVNLFRKYINEATAADVVDAVEYAILEQDAGKMAAMLKDMETRDLVEVVRCCDCKYCETVIHSIVDEPKWFCTRRGRQTIFNMP